MKTLRQQFALLRNDPRFGGRSSAVEAAQQRALLLAIGTDPAAAPRSYAWQEYLAYYRARFVPQAARTFGTALAGFALLLSGWMTTVHAASRSLPGDPLYGLKIITEQAQLRVASLEERAMLHTTFAERRLQEVVELQANGNDENALEAISAFRHEVASANSSLQELQTTNSEVAATTAGAVEERLGALDSVLDNAVAVATNPQVSTEAQAAKDASREVQSTAVGVVVDDHEVDGGEQSQRELNAMFLREYGDVQARQEFDAHRVSVVRNAIAAQQEKLAGATLPTASDLDAMEKAIAAVGERIGDAMDAFAIGGYRSAFDQLDSLDGELLLMESRLAQVEITITAAPEPLQETNELVTP